MLIFFFFQAPSWCYCCVKPGWLGSQNTEWKNVHLPCCSTLNISAGSYSIMLPGWASTGPSVNWIPLRAPWGRGSVLSLLSFGIAFRACSLSFLITSMQQMRSTEGGLILAKNPREVKICEFKWMARVISFGTSGLWLSMGTHKLSNSSPGKEEFQKYLGQ